MTMTTSHYTAQDYADAVEAATKHLRRHDVLGDLMHVEYQIDVSTTESVTNDGVEMPSAPVVEWVATGYVEAYAGDPVSVDYSRNSARESSAPEDVAERIALVWEEAANLALRWEIQRMWETLTGDDSGYPGEPLEVRDLNHVYLEIVIWEHYFAHHVGNNVSPREVVAAYNAAPDVFGGKRDAFVNIYGAKPSALVIGGEGDQE